MTGGGATAVNSTEDGQLSLQIKIFHILNHSFGFRSQIFNLFILLTVLCVPYTKCTMRRSHLSR